jgi:hypothetical protein
MNDSLKLLLKGVATQNLRIPDVLLTHPFLTPANFDGTNPATTPTNTVKYPVFGD